ncbi:arylamine N-acetyltransferase [Hyalangium sp.]|uniref:arylamine N-acetyltransferase family protein n=1 Tax=Hyalangium sp. TaxID=2028555 RepID=UPI002D3A765E|nr:arylamine N-acetyltransferase [Hyalangium sp.]HYI01241.1 arylamine N-acetyltransferase [Hyalangium sp.]
MTPAIDVNAYLARIGHAGAVRPTLETLRELVPLHARAIPFENLNPLLGLPVLLDAASLERKLVHEGRGGYCFEHNLLLKHVLEAIGFDVHGLAARVLWNQPEDALTARGHMLLRVNLEGQTLLVDVGFGGMTLTGVLRLEPGLEQATPHEPFRLLESGGDFRMQARVRGEWKTLYRFDLQEQFQPDYEVTNYYLSTHPRSHFRTGLVAARAEADRRYALRNSQLTIHLLGGPSEVRVLTSAAELRESLERDFLLKLPEDPQLELALARL